MSVPEYLKSYNGTQNGSTPSAPDVDFSQTTPDPTAWRAEHCQANGWQRREPRYVHSVRWTDADGLEHLHVLRSDSLSEVLSEIRILKQDIAKARAKQQTAQDPAKPAVAETPEGWCAIHSVQMGLRHGKHGPWWQHTDPANGTVCKGKGWKGGR